MSIDLHRKRAYYLAHQDTLAQLYDGQFDIASSLIRHAPTRGELKFGGSGSIGFRPPA